MSRSCFLLIVALQISLFGSISAQNLINMPESVAFDTLRNRCLVSNVGDGAIVSIDDYMNQEYFITGLTQCLGNVISGDVIYVSVPDGIMGFDLVTADTVLDMTLPTVGHTDGLAADTSGFIYVVDTAGRIFKVNPVTAEYSYFVYNSITAGLQDITFDEINNRLLTVAYSSNAPIHSVSLEDSSVTLILNTPFGYMDGITRDQLGNTYVTTYSNYGGIYRYDPDFSTPPELVSSPHNGPAGIDYNRRDNILAVPNFYWNTITFVDIVTTSIVDGRAPSNFTLTKNYPNPFNASTTIEYELKSPMRVRVEIFDMLGRTTATLYNGHQDAGRQRVIWDARGFSSGSYFYRISTDYYSAADRMVLLR